MPRLKLSALALIFIIQICYLLSLLKKKRQKKRNSTDAQVIYWKYLILKFIVQQVYTIYKFSAKETKMTTKTVTCLKTSLKFENILTLVQTSLEENFKILAETVDQHSTDISKNTETTQKNERDIQQILKNFSKMEEQNNQLREQISQLKSAVPQKNQNVDSAKKNNNVNNPQKDLNQDLEKYKSEMAKIMEKNKSQNSDLHTKQKNMEKQILLLKAELRKVNQNEANKNSSEINNKLNQTALSTKNLEKQITSLRDELTRLSKQSKSSGTNNKQLWEKFRQHVRDYQNFKAEDYQIFNQNTTQRLQNLEQMMEKVNNSLSEQERLRNKLAQEVYQIESQMKNGDQAKLESQINSDNIKKLQREVSDILKKLQQLFPNKNKGGDLSHNKNSTFNETVIDSMEKKNNNADQDKIQELREEMNQRMRDLRQDFLKGIKRIDMKTSYELQNLNKRIDNLQEGLLRLQHLLNDKADLISIKKMISFLENKISYIFNSVLGQNNEEDATIAKKQWYCLSCDKKLDKYQGKIGSHLMTSQFRSKVMQQQSVGGGMNLKTSKSKVDLPQVHKIGQSQESEKFIRAKK